MSRCMIGGVWRAAAARLRTDGERFRRRWAGEVAADDSGPYIASARRHVLLVVALGAFAAQLAWQESGRRESADLYGYVESVLAVASAIGERGLTPAAQQYGNKVVDALGGAGWQVKLAALVGPEREQVELVAGSDVRLGTTVDPGNACRPAVAALGRHGDETAEGVAMEVRHVSTWGQTTYRTASFGDVFLVRFGNPCRRVSASWQPFAVARYGEAGLAVVLDERFHDRLGLWWEEDRPASDAEPTGDRGERHPGWLVHASAAQLDRLHGAEPYLAAVDAAYLKERVVRAAWVATYRSFELPDWREAVRAMVDDALGPMGFWGFRLDRSTAVRAASAVLLALCVSFVYRVRRIGPAQRAGGEPWVVLLPRGAVEVAGAVVVAAATFAAVGGVAWATWVYEWQGGGAGAYSVRHGPGAWAFCAPALEVVALALLVRGWCCVGVVAMARWRLDALGAADKP